MQHDLAFADRSPQAAARTVAVDKSPAQKAVEFMSQLAGFAPIRSIRSGDVEAVRNLVHGHRLAALHPVAAPDAPPGQVDLQRVH